MLRCCTAGNSDVWQGIRRVRLGSLHIVTEETVTEEPEAAEVETEAAKEGVEAEVVPEEAKAGEIEVVAEMAEAEGVEAEETEADVKEAETEEVEASAEQPEAEQKEEAEKPAEKPEAETKSVDKTGTKPTEASTDKFANGNIVTGTVLNVNFQQAEIDLGDGEIGVLSGRHYAAGLQVDLTGELKAGDEVEAAVLIRADHNNRVVLSRTWARSQRAWKKIMEAKKNSTVVEAVIVEAVKGGYSVEIDDARGFLPSSLVMRSELTKAAGTSAAEFGVVDGGTRDYEEDATDSKEAVVEEATASAGETDAGGEAELAEADKTTREAEPSDKKLEKSQSEESQSRAPRASDEFVGQIVKCKVIEAKPGSNRYVLSHKAAVRTEQREKEKERIATLERGTIVSGKVVALEDFGAFVDIGGVRGLLHRTEMAWNHPNEPKEIVEIGESVFCKIIKINQQKAQVGLSLCFGENPISKVEVGQRLTGKVDRLAYAGAIVALEIPEGAADGSADSNRADSEEEGASESANGEVPVGEETVTGEAGEAAETAAAESSNPESANGTASSQPSDIPTAPSSPKCLMHGFVHVSEMSEYPIRRPQRVVLPGDEVAVKVIEVQRKQRRIGLSIIDAVVPDELDGDSSGADGGLEANTKENARISDQAEEVPEPKDTTDTEKTSEEFPEENSKAEPQDASEETGTENEDS